MKWLFFILLKNLYLTYYPVEIIECNQSIQVQFQDSVRVLELFNVQVYDMNRACELLKNANVVEIAFEPNIQQDEILSSWVLVDDVLLQQILVDENVAGIVRKNPLYQYQLGVESQEVKAPLQEMIVENRNQGYRIVILHLIVCVFCVVVTKAVKY